MRFPRQARILRGPMDATPVAGVLFLLALFVLLGSVLTTPGTLLRIDLPAGHPPNHLDGPALVVAVDNRGQYFFETTPVSEGDLRMRLRDAAQHTQRLTLVLRPDRGVDVQMLTHLGEIASQAGVNDILLAERPLPER